MIDHNCKKLSVFSFAIAVGVAGGLGTLFVGWMGHFYGWGLEVIKMMGTIYKGYEPSIAGGIAGGLWAFLDGFIWALIVAIIYNFCCRCCSHCHKPTEK